jgi:hypothetical protein
MERDGKRDFIRNLKIPGKLDKGRRVEAVYVKSGFRRSLWRLGVTGNEKKTIKRETIGKTGHERYYTGRVIIIHRWSSSGAWRHVSRLKK